MSCRRVNRPDPAQQVAAWNEFVEVGTEVEYSAFPGAATQRFKTRTPAEVLQGHSAVVWLDGKSGCVSLNSVRPVQEGGVS